MPPECSRHGVVADSLWYIFQAFLDFDSLTYQFLEKSPTVVQSPISLRSNVVSLPVTPILQVEMDRVPFSVCIKNTLRDYNLHYISAILPENT